jgi:hypothetical protein
VEYLEPLAGYPIIDPLAVLVKPFDKADLDEPL